MRLQNVQVVRLESLWFWYHPTGQLAHLALGPRPSRRWPAAQHRMARSGAPPYALDKRMFPLSSATAHPGPQRVWFIFPAL